MSSVTATSVPREEDGANKDCGDGSTLTVSVAVKSNSLPSSGAASADPVAALKAQQGNCDGETAEIKEEPMDIDQTNHKDAAANSTNAVKENNCAQSPTAAATPASTTMTDSESSKPASSMTAAGGMTCSSPSTSQATSSPLPPPPSTSAALSPNRLTFSTTELEVLSELDSSAFGYLKLSEEKHARKKKLATKAISYMEQIVALKNFRKRKRPGGDTVEDDLSNNNDKRTSSSSSSSAAGAVAPVSSSSVKPKVYCKLGHLHLLLEDYTKALSAYRKYNLLAAEEARNDVLFLYGQGLVFFHYNAYHWATRSFQQALYVQPNFARASEVHARLGIMAKINGDLSSSLKYFKLAKKCYESPLETRPCVLSEEGIQFHIAHLHEISGKQSKAIALYKELLDSKGESLSSSLKAEIHRQLGWTYYNAEMLGDKQTRYFIVFGPLSTVKLDKTNNNNNAFYRIQAAIEHLQKSIEIEPKSGHSLYLLGRCFAAIGKVHDAFIAYRNSDDKSESNADTWCSIGVLYQQQNQHMDALQAYIYAVQLEKYHLAAWTNLGLLYESFSQLHDALSCYINAVAKQKTPIPNLHQRIKYLKTQLSGAPAQGPSHRPKQLPSVEEAWNLPVSNEMSGRHSNAMKMTKENKKRDVQQQQQQQGPTGLTQTQLQTLHYLQSQTHLTPQQHHVLQQLQHQQQQMQQQNENKTAAAAEPVDDLLNQLQGKDLSSVSEKDIEAMISGQNIDSLAESLLKQIAGDAPSDSVGPSSNVVGNGVQVNGEVKKECDVDKEDRDDEDDDNVGKKLGSLVDVPTSLDTVVVWKEVQVSSNMSGDEIVEECRKVDQFALESLVSYCPNPPVPPPKPKARAGLSKEQLLPPTPSVYLENKKDAFSPQLQEFCVQQPITVVRGIAGALKLDLGLFSTKTLQESHKKANIEVITHAKQLPEENWDPALGRTVWKSPVTKSLMTVGGYAKYQTAVFQESLKEEQDKPAGYGRGASAAAAAAELENELAMQAARRSKKKNRPVVQFGSFVDLSEQRQWRTQLTELMKLPSWTRVVSGGNLLSHVGYQIRGINTVQLQMKVPGCRTLAHQEPNNFCAVDINIGPGECEWFAIPFEYWGVVASLCEKHGVSLARGGNWWPNMKDLMDEEIPVYRFMQRPGDLVWVNSGCINWTQSVGWSNNIRWNVGPLGARQYSVALERYQWNKLQSVPSAVPLVHLSWNLAKNIKINQNDERLYTAIRKTLRESLKRFILLVDYVKQLKVEPKFHGRRKYESAHQCSLCEAELFGIFFVKEAPNGTHVVNCIDCVRAESRTLSGYVCLQEYHVSELVRVYDNFRMQQVPNAPQSHNSTISHGHGHGALFGSAGAPGHASAGATAAAAGGHMSSSAAATAAAMAAAAAAAASNSNHVISSY